MKEGGTKDRKKRNEMKRERRKERKGKRKELHREYPSLKNMWVLFNNNLLVKNTKIQNKTQKNKTKKYPRKSEEMFIASSLNY